MSCKEKNSLTHFANLSPGVIGVPGDAVSTGAPPPLGEKYIFGGGGEESHFLDAEEGAAFNLVHPRSNNPGYAHGLVSKSAELALCHSGFKTKQLVGYVKRPFERL